MRPRRPCLEQDPSEILARARERQTYWRKQYRIWNIVHYSFSVWATGLTLASAALPAILTTYAWVLPLMSLVAALLVAFIAFWTPSKQARSYIAAWRLLDSKLRWYEHLKTPEALLEVDAAIDEGERILAGKDPY